MRPITATGLPLATKREAFSAFFPQSTSRIQSVDFLPSLPYRSTAISTRPYASPPFVYLSSMLFPSLPTLSQQFIARPPHKHRPQLPTTAVPRLVRTAHPPSNSDRCLGCWRSRKVNRADREI